MENEIITEEMKKNLDIIALRLKCKKITKKNILKAIQENIDFAKEMADGKTERAKKAKSICMRNVYGLYYIMGKEV
jgi:hypothetical protein